MYLVICNISKRPNVQALFSTAAAFGCKGVFVVGQKSFDTNPTGPDIPTPIRNYILEGKMTIQRFANWAEFLEFIKGEHIRLLGVEIHKDAKAIDEYFDNSNNATVKTAFLMGNEGQGLSKKQLESCDGFVRIPQYGNGTASLNVYVACSIVLQRYHQWALGL
jgi:tRNA G18 (ribose-2'-O)-methylase SpoU